MKNPELFHKSIGILVNAFINETLTHKKCCACAIGNLIAGNNGYNPKDSATIGSRESWLIQRPGSSIPTVIIPTYWTDVHCGGSMRKGRTEYPSVAGIKQLESTGYNIYQTCQIEAAFENVLYEMNDKDGYNGLMRVVDVLIGIHEGTEDEKKTAKALFVKEAV